MSEQKPQIASAQISWRIDGRTLGQSPDSWIKQLPEDQRNGAMVAFIRAVAETLKVELHVDDGLIAYVATQQLGDHLKGAIGALTATLLGLISSVGTASAISAQGLAATQPQNVTPAGLALPPGVTAEDALPRSPITIVE